MITAKEVSEEGDDLFEVGLAHQYHRTLWRAAETIEELTKALKSAHNLVEATRSDLAKAQLEIEDLKRRRFFRQAPPDDPKLQW